MTSVLSSSDVKSLSKKARELMTAEIEYGRADMSGNRRARQKANQNLQKAREAFNKDWDGRVRKHGDLLAHMADIVAVFENCYEYEKPSRPTLGAPQDMDGMATIVVPSRYRPANTYRGVLLIPSVKGAALDDARPYWESTWKASTLADETLICMPTIEALPEGGLDDAKGLFLPEGQGREGERIGALLRPFLGGMVQQYNVDRDRMVLDCGVGSSAFGLRLASYFPNRFAAVVLRDAQPLNKDIRLEGLAGIPVLLVEHANNAAAVKELADVLNGLAADSCTVVKSEAEAPFGDAQAAIDAWLADKKRQMFRSKVVIANNHDLFRKSFWVEMGTAEPLAGVPVAERPMLTVEADKAGNRIVVTARNVETFTLYLNDALVNLDEAFTVEINGKAFKEQRGRSLANMTEWCNEKFDPGFLFTATYSSSVPEAGGSDNR